MPDAPRTVDFCGEQIRLVERVSDFALMEFAEAAERVDSESMAGMAAVMRLLQEAVVSEDWPRFRSLARKHHASVEDCMEIVMVVFEVETDRPTGRPSDSSDGPETTEPSSGAVVSSPVVRRLEALRRPDLAAFVKQAETARSA